jgi:hypothetical protein
MVFTSALTLEIAAASEIRDCSAVSSGVDGEVQEDRTATKVADNARNILCIIVVGGEAAKDTNERLNQGRVRRLLAWAKVLTLDQLSTL